MGILGKKKIEEPTEPFVANVNTVDGSISKPQTEDESKPLSKDENLEELQRLANVFRDEYDGVFQPSMFAGESTTNNLLFAIFSELRLLRELADKED